MNSITPCLPPLDLERGNKGVWCRHLTIPIASIAIILSSISLQAQDPLTSTKPVATDSTHLDTAAVFDATQVVVSASRWEERASTVSREIITVTPAQISRNNPPTTADAIAQTGLVSVQKSQLGGGSPMLRGYAANAVLMVIDGVRMNNAIYRSGNLQNSITVDALALDGMEILFGPGSVQYGSDALGGVMAFRTRRPTFADTDSTLHFSGASMLRYSSAMNELTGSVAIDLGNDRLASSTVITYSYFDDLRGGNSFMSAYPDFGKRPWYVERIDGKDSIITNPSPNLQTPTGYSQVNIIENLHWKIDRDLTLEYGGLFTTSTDVPRYDRLLEEANGLPRSAEWYYGPQLWTSHALTLRINNMNGLADNAVITGSFQFYEESRNDRRFNNSSLRNQTESVLIGALNADFRKQLHNDGPTETDLYYGVEAYVNDVSSEATRTNIITNEVTPTTTRYPDGGSIVTSAAAYAQLRHGVSRDLTLAAGIRYTWYDLSSSSADSTRFPVPSSQFPDDLGFTTSALTGSLGATYMLAPFMTIHGNVASGFRAPNVDDISKVFESAPGILVIPNPDLGPEYAYTLEGGVQWRPASSVSVDVNAYHTWAVDAIEVRQTSFNGVDTIDIDGVPTAIYANTNVGEASIFGVNAVVRATMFDHLICDATASYNQAEDVNGVPLRHVPPIFGTVRLRWQQPSWSVGASFWWAAAKPFDELPPEEQAKVGINYTQDGTPAWQRLDLSASYRLMSTMEAIVMVENLFDLNYHTFASALSAPGRNIVASVRWSF